jgi:hypothetical protein
MAKGRTYFAGRRSQRANLTGSGDKRGEMFAKESGAKQIDTGNAENGWRRRCLGSARSTRLRDGTVDPRPQRENEGPPKENSEL